MSLYGFIWVHMVSMGLIIIANTSKVKIKNSNMRIFYFLKVLIFKGFIDHFILPWQQSGCSFNLLAYAYRVSAPNLAL